MLVLEELAARGEELVREEVVDLFLAEGWLGGKDWLEEENWLVEKDWLGEEAGADIEEEVEEEVVVEAEMEVEVELGPLIGAWDLRLESRLRGCFREYFHEEFHVRLPSPLFLLHSVQTSLFGSFPTPNQRRQLRPKGPRRPCHHWPRLSQTILAGLGTLSTRSLLLKRYTLHPQENCFDGFVVKGGRGNQSLRNGGG